MYHDTAQPPGVQALERDIRDVPIPVHVGRVAGQPARITEIDHDRRLILTALRRCTICGWKVPTNELCWYVAVPSAIDALRRANWMGSDEAIEGAGHEECLVYSAIVCPFLRDPAYERRTAMRAEGRIVAPKGTQTGEMVLAGAPEVITRFERFAGGGFIKKTAVGGGEMRVHEFATGDDLRPLLHEMLATTPPRRPDAADLQFVELITSDDGRRVPRLARQTELELGVEAGFSVDAGRSTPCPCRSGMVFEYCCFERCMAAAKRRRAGRQRAVVVDGGSSTA